MNAVEEIMKGIKARGLKVCVSPDGQPFLRGPKEEKTPALLEAVKFFRDEILALPEVEKTELKLAFPVKDGGDDIPTDLPERFYLNDKQLEDAIVKSNLEDMLRGK